MCQVSSINGTRAILLESDVLPARERLFEPSHPRLRNLCSTGKQERPMEPTSEARSARSSCKFSAGAGNCRTLRGGQATAGNTMVYSMVCNIPWYVTYHGIYYGFMVCTMVYSMVHTMAYTMVYTILCHGIYHGTSPMEDTP